MLKIIHFIWIGEGLPRRYQNNISAWKNRFPHYEVVVHYEFPNTVPKWVKSLRHMLPNAMSEADLLRYWLMYSRGGLYADLDSRPIKNIEELVGKTFITEVYSKELDQSTAASFFIGASCVKSEFWKHILNVCEVIFNHQMINKNDDMPLHISRLLGLATHPSYETVTNFVEHDQSFIPRNSVVIDDTEEQLRLDTCNSCEHLTGERCAKCGCNGRHRSRISTVHCPIGKW